MKLRQGARLALVSAAYLLLHLGSELLSQRFPAGPQAGLREASGFAFAFLVLCRPRMALVIVAAQLITFLAIDPSNPGFFLSAAYSLIAAGGYAGMAWLVRERLGPAPLPKRRREGILLLAVSIAAPLPAVIVEMLAAKTGPWPVSTQVLAEVAFRWAGAVGSILAIVPCAVIFIGPWIVPGRRRPEGTGDRPSKWETLAQAAAFLAVLYAVVAWEPVHRLDLYPLFFVPLAWIVLSHGLPGAAVAVLGINLGTYLGMCIGGASPGVAANTLLLSIAVAAVGLGLGTMVSLREQAERTLAQNQLYLAQVLSGARLGLWNVDLKADRTQYDESYAEMLGYRLEEIASDRKSWEGRIHPDDKPRVTALLDGHLEGSSPHYEADYRIRMRQGGWKWIHARGAVIERTPDGAPLRIAGTHLDLTERKTAEVEKNRLLNIIEASSDFIATSDLEFRPLYLNPAFRRLVGVGDLSPAGGPRLSDGHPKWAMKIIMEEALPAVHAKGVWVGESALLDAQGREVPVSQLILLHRDDDGQPAAYSTIARDISRQKEVEAVRLATERKMLQAQKLESLGVMAGGIAHDFNNLLTAMLGNASLVEMDLPEGSPILSSVGQIRTAALRAAELCKQMLAYSGRGYFTPSRADLSAIVENTKQLLNASITKRCVLAYDLPRGLPPVEVDEGQIRQVLVNLAINASDAIGEQSGLIRISTGLTRQDSAQLAKTLFSPDLPPGDYVLLEVSDNGGGMEPGVAARIFEPFFTTKFAGRGLGLPAALGIVRAHRGAITVQSEPGRGSTFRILLPASDGPADAAPEPASARPAKPHIRATILVVDDEETVRTVASRLLESAGFGVVLAEDGRRALEIFKSRPQEFSAVLLDLTMPHMNGEETFQELRKIRPEVPVVLMSGFSEEDSLDRFGGRELAGFVPKPFDRESLIAKFRSIGSGGAGA
ncbi:MAG: PAS domain-containing protein [Opitutaceae bacterium]